MASRTERLFAEECAWRLDAGQQVQRARCIGGLDAEGTVEQHIGMCRWLELIRFRRRATYAA